MLMSATYTKKIFTILPDNKLKGNWKKLRVLMFVFFLGYIVAMIIVFLGKTEILALLSGIIFFMGSLFVFMVVRSGLASFRKLKSLNQDLDDTQLKNEELQQFAYITSHDLKTPIRGISSLASFIEEDIKSGEIDQVYGHLSTIQNQVERLENLINGILNYSKIGKIKIEPVDLDELVREEFNNYRNLGNVVLKIEEKLPVINGDKIQLSQVVANLMNNAIKHNDKKVCELYISSVEKKEFYEILFEDNGPGIDIKYHQKIFEVFQTLDEDNSTKFIISYPKV